MENLDFVLNGNLIGHFNVYVECNTFTEEYLRGFLEKFKNI